VVKEGGEEVRWSFCDAVRIVTAARAGGAQFHLQRQQLLRSPSRWLWWLWSRDCQVVGRGKRHEVSGFTLDELFRDSRVYSLIGYHSLVQLCTLIWSKCILFGVHGCYLLL
jgi:hypothetical protein